MGKEKQITGWIGEEAAAAYLRARGYLLYGRNARLRHDEIDIIAYDPAERVLVFAEVKARGRAHRDYTPGLNYSERKQRTLLRAARRWVAQRQYAGSYRIDLLCVVGGKVVDHLREVNNPL
jgi:putative endonuclease